MNWLQNAFSTKDGQIDLRQGRYVATCWKSSGVWKWHIIDLQAPAGAMPINRSIRPYTRGSSARAAAEAALSVCAGASSTL